MSHILVCLHGWGGSKDSFTELRAALKGSDITILTPDLPGFGAEPEPTKAWTVDDYADWVTNWVNNETSKLVNHQTSKPITIHLLGHSHGGRISIKIVTSHQSRVTRNFSVEHLYLCASAGIKRPRHLKRVIGLTLAKIGRALLSIPGLSLLAPLGRKLLYKLVRVHDYEQASPLMQQTLIKVTQEDLRPLLKDIKVPTDLFWGRQDGMTPFADALVMEKEIQGSILHAFDGVRHGVHRDCAISIAQVIRSRMNIS